MASACAGREGKPRLTTTAAEIARTILIGDSLEPGKLRSTNMNCAEADAAEPGSAARTTICVPGGRASRLGGPRCSRRPRAPGPRAGASIADGRVPTRNRGRCIQFGPDSDSFERFRRWRRERDSNPREPFGPYAISSRADSTTLASLRGTSRTALIGTSVLGMAEREGFEPPVPLRVQRFSRPPHSTSSGISPHPNVPDERAGRRRYHGAPRRTTGAEPYR